MVKIAILTKNPPISACFMEKYKNFLWTFDKLHILRLIFSSENDIKSYKYLRNCNFLPIFVSIWGWFVHRNTREQRGCLREVHWYRTKSRRTWAYRIADRNAPHAQHRREGLSRDICWGRQHYSSQISGGLCVLRGDEENRQLPREKHLPWLHCEVERAVLIRENPDRIGQGFLYAGRCFHTRTSWKPLTP